MKHNPESEATADETIQLTRWDEQNCIRAAENAERFIFPAENHYALTKHEWLIGTLAAGFCANPEIATNAIPKLAANLAWSLLVAMEEEAR